MDSQNGQKINTEGVVEKSLTSEDLPDLEPANTLASSLDEKYKKYNAIRDAAHRALEALMASDGVELFASHITDSAIAETKTWENRRYKHWDWSQWAHKFRSIPARFDLALRAGPERVLCGLAYGAPHRKRKYLGVQILEGNPAENHPLKGDVLTSILECAVLYGRQLGCPVLRVLDPMPELVSTYEALGFLSTLIGQKVAYCEQRILVKSEIIED